MFYPSMDGKVKFYRLQCSNLFIVLTLSIVRYEYHNVCGHTDQLLWVLNLVISMHKLLRSLVISISDSSTIVDITVALVINRWFGHGFLSALHFGPFFQSLLSVNSGAVIPLVTKSAGVCYVRKYFHSESLVDSRISYTLFATNLFNCFFVQPK